MAERFGHGFFPLPIDLLVFFRDLLLCTCGQTMVDIIRRGQTRTKGAFISRGIGRAIASSAYG